MKKIITIILLFSLIFIISSCTKEKEIVKPKATIEEKQEEKQEEKEKQKEEKTVDLCVKKDTNYQLTFDEAEEIAKNSECLQEGKLKETYFCNEYTGTWWLDLNVEKKPGCNPACVINVETKKAEINWRCTGLIPEK